MGQITTLPSTSTPTVTSVSIDYTNDIIDLVTAIDKISSNLLTLNNTLVQGLNALNDTNKENNLTISKMSSDLTAITQVILDPSIGVSVNQVDWPYQGRYQRGITRMALTDEESLDIAVQKENQASMFKL